MRGQSDAELLRQGFTHRHRVIGPKGDVLVETVHKGEASLNVEVQASKARIARGEAARYETERIGAEPGGAPLLRRERTREP